MRRKIQTQVSEACGPGDELVLHVTDQKSRSVTPGASTLSVPALINGPGVEEKTRASKYLRG